MSKSEWDRSVLPRHWQQQPAVCKSQVIAFLQGRTLCPPYWWTVMLPEERRAVVLHLCAVGSVKGSMARVRSEGGPRVHDATCAARHARTDDEPSACEQVMAFRDRHPQLLQAFGQGMLYGKPNSGNRILPSIYTRLTDRWLRGSGVWQNPASMNRGHLQNTVALLNESHVNFVDRVTTLLGKMHAHLGNRPDLQAKLEDLHHEFEGLEVDELYPIIELLASFIGPEQPRAETDPYWLDGHF